MQSLKHQKWVLAVVRGDFTEYQVTDVMSGNVDVMVQYADYLNKGKIGPGLDSRSILMLETVRSKYIRCEMTPASVGGEKQDSISGGIQSPI